MRRVSNKHCLLTFFIALTFAGSLGRCLTTQPNSLVFKQLPWDPVDVNVWKKTCVIPIFWNQHYHNAMPCLFKNAFMNSGSTVTFRNQILFSFRALVWHRYKILKAKWHIYTASLIIEPRHEISNNLTFWQVYTQRSLCSLLLGLETPSGVQSVA